jgi:hypothetical protein
MAKAKEAASTGLSERHLQIVGSFEVQTVDAQPQVPLHLIAGAQDNPLALATGYSL